MKVPFVSLKPMHAPLREKFKTAFENVLDSDWYILGKSVEQFEKEYAAFNKVQYCLGVGNGLDALIIALKALQIKPDDEIVVPANSFIATALAVTEVKAKIVFCEPDPLTYNMTAKTLEPVLTSKTKCVIPVHLYGQSCEMAPIMELSQKRGFYVVEDNAQAQGATYRDRLTGSWGHINATSFYPGKNLGALGDAGGITTNDFALAERARMIRSYGSKQKYQHEVLGQNSRLDELQAALLSIKLKELENWTRQRQAIAAFYTEGLMGTGDLILPQVAPQATHTFHLYVIQTERRDELQTHLKAAGVETLIHYPTAIHQQKAYAFMPKQNLPVSETIARRCLSLPMYPGLAPAELQHVVQSVKDFF